MIIYNLSSIYSFQNLDPWLEGIHKITTKSVPMLIVGNGEPDRRVISFEEGKEYAENKGLGYFEISTKTNENIDKAIDILISEMIKCFEEKKEKNKKKINDEGLNKKRKRNTNCILI